MLGSQGDPQAVVSEAVNTVVALTDASQRRRTVLSLISTGVALNVLRLYQSQLGSAFVNFAPMSVLNFVLDHNGLHCKLEQAITQLKQGDIAGYLESALQAVDWLLSRLEKAPQMGSELGGNAPSLQGLEELISVLSELHATMALPTAAPGGSGLDDAAQQLCSGMLSQDAAEEAAAKLELEQLLLWQWASAEGLSAMTEAVAASLPVPMGGAMDEEEVFTTDQPMMDLEGHIGAEMMTPVLIKVDYYTQVVLFATDRNLVQQAEILDKTFGSQQQDGLTYGRVEVSIPKDRVPGSMDARKPHPWIFPGHKEYKNFHVSIVDLTVLRDRAGPSDSKPSARQQFLSQVAQAVADSATKELVLFIHGYNVSFAAAIKSAGQLAFDTAQDYSQSATLLNQRAALAFDWASCSALASYGFVPWGHDRERAEAAAPKLAQLLKDLADHVGGCSKVHIVAHSMGNYVLFCALRDLFRSEGRLQGPMSAAAALFRLTRSITFAAPDLAKKDFRMLLDLVEKFGDDSGHTPVLTLYCSRRDLALVVSSGLRTLGHDKAGRAGFFWRRPHATRIWWGHYMHPVLDPRILTVDATSCAEDLMGHGYFRSNRQVLEDISNIMAGRDRDTVIESDEHNRCEKTCRPLVSAGGCRPLQCLRERQIEQWVKRLLPKQVLEGDDSASDDSGDSDGHAPYMVGNRAVEVVCEGPASTDSAGLADEQASDEQAADEQAADEQAADEQAADERAADERAADEQAADEQAADERAADEQAADEQTGERDSQQMVAYWQGIYTGAGRYVTHFS